MSRGNRTQRDLAKIAALLMRGAGPQEIRDAMCLGDRALVLLVEKLRPRLRERWTRMERGTT